MTIWMLQMSYLHQVPSIFFEYRSPIYTVPIYCRRQEVRDKRLQQLEADNYQEEQAGGTEEEAYEESDVWPSNHFPSSFDCSYFVGTIFNYWRFKDLARRNLFVTFPQLFCNFLLYLSFLSLSLNVAVISSFTTILQEEIGISQKKKKVKIAKRLSKAGAPR